MRYETTLLKSSSLIAKEIPEDAANYISQLFKEISEKLALIADKKRQDNAFSVAEITHTRHVDLLVAMLIDEGKTLSEAINALEKFDVSEKNIRFLWQNVGSRIKEKKQKERIKAAHRMRSNGKNTDFISKRLGVTKRTAQRYLISS